jgi:predicted XRE-type DNA-binding protein
MIDTFDLLSECQIQKGLLKLKSRMMLEIKRHKDENKITQQEIAKLCGITQSRVSNIINGHYSSVSIDELLRCMLVLGIEFKLLTPIDFK